MIERKRIAHFHYSREDVAAIEGMDSEGPTPIRAEVFERDAVEVTETEEKTA